MKIKKSLLFLIFILSALMLARHHSSTGIETKAYVIALGIDKRRNKYL